MKIVLLQIVESVTFALYARLHIVYVLSTCLINLNVRKNHYFSK